MTRYKTGIIRILLVKRNLGKYGNLGKPFPFYHGVIRLEGAKIAKHSPSGGSVRGIL